MNFNLPSSISLVLIAASIGLIFNNINNTEIEYVTVAKNSTGISPSTAVRNSTSETDSKSLDILDLDTFRFASVDGSIKVDKNNALIIDQDLRHWFDFYLSALGEISLQNIISMMQLEINKLPSPGQDQALKILDQYLAYKRELGEYDNRELLTVNQHNDIEHLTDRLDWQMRLRRRYLDDDVVESFWHQDEVIDNYALEKLTIKNSNLSDADKQAKLLALDQSLPESLYTFKQELYVASNLLKKEKALSQTGSPQALRELRIKEVGIEAANRLEVIDEKQRSWNVKVLSYHNEEERLSKIEGMSITDKEAILTQYREDHFKNKEILRLPAAIKLLSDTL